MVGSRFLNRWQALSVAALSAGRARIFAGLEALTSASTVLVDVAAASAQALGEITAATVVQVGSRASVDALLDEPTATVSASMPVGAMVDFSFDEPAILFTVVTEFTITLPAANYAANEATARTMGSSGCHLAMNHFRLVGTTRYVYWTRAGVGVDPGPYASELAGLTGIAVDLPASSQTDVENATAVASAIDAISGLTATSSGADVTINGAAGATAGTTTFATRGRQGIIGTPDNRAFTDLSSTTGTIRGAALDATRWGSRPIVITGFSLGVGTSHDDPIVISAYQGGVAGQPDGATLLGHIGSTSGGGNTSTIERVSSDGVYADPGNGLIWIMVMNATGVQTMYTYATRPGTTGHDWITFGSGERICVPGNGTTSSDSADLPATLTESDSADDAVGMPAIQISFVDAEDFQRDMQPGMHIGTLAGLAAGARDLTFTFGSSTATPFCTGNRYTMPSDFNGLEVYSLACNYAVHALGEDLGAHVCIGGDAVDDWGGGTVHGGGACVGLTGTDIGWVEVVVPAGIAIAAGEDFFLLIESPEGSTTANAFDLGAPDVFEADVWGDAPMYQGEASEAGYEPLSSPFISPGEETTNLSFDASTYGVAPSQTVAQVVQPDGLLINDGNNAGIRAALILRGWVGA